MSNKDRVLLKMLANDKGWYYDPATPCAHNPEKNFAMSPFLAVEEDFPEIFSLKEVEEGDMVYVETPDLVMQADYKTGEFSADRRLWRKCRIISLPIQQEE